MKIFDNEPSDWIDLQNKVAYIFKSCGYDVKTPMKIKTARGEVEVDVYAYAESLGIRVIVECKLWKRKLSQDIIYSFRSIVNDSGVNKGIIVSKRGFQSGAYNNARFTNIELLTWDEFVDKYQEHYLKSMVRKYQCIKSKLYRLSSDKREYQKYIDQFDTEAQKEVGYLKEKLFQIVLVISPMCTMLQYEMDETIGWNVKYLETLIKEAEESFHKNFNSYYDFFEYINEEIHNITLNIGIIYGIKIPL